ncbi:sigma-70 family RNA polymerase sigma factor [Dulcicalothrix desertica]|nr:sigma-70 family RNA polymerase sigma factor [Dulcicalothrix desertica]
MKKRDDTIQKFSTFLMFEGVNKRLNIVWQTDLQLERHMKRLIQSESEVKAEYWAHYFLKIIKVNQAVQQVSSSSDCFVKARGHLSSYLQEACLWAAHKSFQRFSFIRHKYPLSELFQIANLAVNPPEKLFKTFDVEHPQANLNAYAKTAILRFTGNLIYAQDIEAKRDKFTDYGLLKDLTAKELKEALLARGINQNNINYYYLAWQCFDEIYLYNPANRKLGSEEILQIGQITSYYNQRCEEFNLTTQSVAQVQNLLLTCIQAARNYRTKKFSPLDEQINVTDCNSSLLENLIQHEEWQETQSLIKKLFLTLPEQGQLMLKLWHGLGLTQTEIAGAITNKYTEIQKQYQVARHLGKYTKTLLDSLISQWQKNLREVKVYDDKNIEAIKDAMNDCLQVYTQQEFFNTLDRVARIKIADNISFNNIENDNIIKQKLINAFQEELETTTQLGINALDGAKNKLAIFIDNWLINRNTHRTTCNHTAK